MTIPKPIMSILVAVYDNGTCSFYGQALEGFNTSTSRRKGDGTPTTHLNELPDEIRNALEMSGLIDWPTYNEEPDHEKGHEADPDQ